MPVSPWFLFLGGLLLAVLAINLNFHLIELSFEKLGLSPEAAFALLLVSLLGSAINLPLFTLDAVDPEPLEVVLHRGFLRPSPRPFTGRTVVAINVGGGLVPVFFSLYLLRTHPVDLAALALATGLISVVCYLFSRPIPGMGIGMPILVAPLAAALVAVVVGATHERAELAYIAGVMGVLIGADLCRLRDIRQMGAPVASIGGAGTFDGIFITGIIAVLLT